MSEPITLLEGKALAKRYQRGAEEVHALRGVDVSLTPGQVVALFGPSGSGKSTLLAVLCGWEHVDGGELEVAGDLSALVAADLPWAELAIVPQALGLLDDLTVRENVALPIKLAKRRDDGRVEALLIRLGLDELANRRPRETSLGQQQRAAVARALVLEPRVLLVDEPSTHQDSGWARVVFETLREAAQAGAAVLLATHDPEGHAYCDRVLEMRDGVLHEAT